MRRESSRVSIPGLVEALRQAGASFRQTSGGCWLLDAGTSLPGWLADAFYQADEKALAAHLRAAEQAASRTGPERALMVTITA